MHAVVRLAGDLAGEPDAIGFHFGFIELEPFIVMDLCEPGARVAEHPHTFALTLRTLTAMVRNERDLCADSPEL